MTAMVTTRTSVDRPVKAAAPPARRRWPSDFACKQVMAVTGIVFGLFVLVHMIGNLKAYLGPQHFDEYAMWLRHLAEPLVPYSGVLWALRVVLLACLVGHVGCAYLLTRRAWVARGRWRRTGLPLRSLPDYHGTAISWEDRAVPRSTAFVVELRAGPADTALHARAVLALARRYRAGA